MLQDVVHPPEQLPIFVAQEGSLSSISAQMLDFSDDGELFPETLHASEASSSSAGRDIAGVTGTDNLYSYDAGATAIAAFSPFSRTETNSLSVLLEMPPQDCDTHVKAIGHSSPSSMHSVAPLYSDNQKQEQFDQIIVADTTLGGYSTYSNDSGVSLPAGSMLPVFEECLLLACMESGSSTQCGLLDMSSGTSYSAMGTPACGGESRGFFTAGMMVGMEELVEYQRADSSETGFYKDSIQPIYSSGNIQVIRDEQYHLVRGGCSSRTSITPEIPTLDDHKLKVGRLSIEERKNKIHRYMKKRNERNFSKKIKYACRKTLADSRPRVRGRFAKNDELGEAMRSIRSNHEYDDDEVMVKEEEELPDSSDILAHISGVNSFKYNYTPESWT